MEIKSQKIDIVDIGQLIPYNKNMNDHTDEQIDRLIELIKYQGFRDPIIVQKGTNIIAAGHGRVLAAKKMGMTKVPVTYQEFESEAQFYAFVVSHNAINSNNWGGGLDFGKINTDFVDLGPELDIDMLGIKDFVVEPIEKFEPKGDEDAVPEVKENPVTKRGDVWLLGDHRVMCGDSTMIDDVEKLMNGEKADMVFTDPPYGMNLDTDYSKMSKTNRPDKIIRNIEDKKRVTGDGSDFSPELINTIFCNFNDCKEVFIWGADYFAEMLHNKNDGSWVVWDKKTTEGLEKMFGSHFELCWSKNKHKREIARITWAGCFGHNKKDDGDKKNHPTQKPVKLPVWFFEKWCEGLNLCADLFLGSGSTLIACEKTNRKCYGMELDEYYCDVIINRWQQYTGKKAVLESNNKTYDELKNEKQG